MKKNLFILLLITAVISNAQNSELKLASDVWPPFTDKKEKDALAFELVEEAFNRINIHTNFVVTDFKNVLTGIETEKFQGSSALWKTKEREELLLFSDAYLNNQLKLIGRSGSHVDLSSLKELSGKKIGLVKGYAYGNGLFEIPNLEIKYGKSAQENLENLISKNVDYILVDAILLQYMLNYQINDVSRLLEISKKPLINRSLHVALGKSVPNAKEIIERLNKEFKTMISDGSYNKILHMDWIRADVDGDGDLELIFTGDQLGTTEPTIAYNLQTEAHINDETAYYVNGVRYESWEDVPGKYKVELPEKIQYIPIDNFGVILNF